ncbi:hypothetical protein EVAR_20822_1 [Eumeta japonica]|uniref:Uncharacterized protein n=1 Tax=Eumeta variegata TaxID=151549 RepID=A0A4C1UDP2_EUMVA|nr:hypothetical protein EVAR_20822_1 [Eumeta japonica]
MCARASPSSRELFNQLMKYAFAQIQFWTGPSVRGAIADSAYQQVARLRSCAALSLPTNTHLSPFAKRCSGKGYDSSGGRAAGGGRRPAPLNNADGRFVNGKQYSRQPYTPFFAILAI